jgi:hypothetical protein
VVNPYPFVVPDVSWIDSMSNIVQNYLTIHGLNNWQVYGYKWVNNSWTYSPSDALNNAKKEGQHLGSSIVAQGWTHVHFIAHSAGAALIQTATDVIKNPSASPGTEVHETFLDPFVGFDYAGVFTYGRGANWADQYFTRDKTTEIGGLFTIGQYTESPVFHAYNVDVTPLDPNKGNYIKFGSSDSGAQIIETCHQTETTHEWPIYFYTNTIVGNVDQYYAGFGFPLCEEENSSLSSLASQYPPGNGVPAYPNTTTKVLGIPDSVCTVLGQISPPSYPDTKPDFTQTPSVDSTTGTIQKQINSIKLITGSPVWTAMFVSSTNPVNVVSFDAQFTDMNGAQGMLSAYWDTNMIGAVDERVVEPGLQHYMFTFRQAAAYTTHMLGFRLDPFTNVESSILLTNIILNQVGVSQPFSLSLTTNMVNGLRVLRLDGEAGFNYNIQASTELGSTNWTDVAILENTNGTVFFYDPDSINYNQRYYRAVAP